LEENLVLLKNSERDVPGGNFLVRRVRREELDELLTLYRHLHRKDAPPPARSALNALWISIMADPHLLYFVGELNREIISSCALAIIPNLTRGGRPYGLIENVVTHADYRNRGFGTAVVRQALQAAWNANCYKVMLSTGSKEESTLRFYENAGFQRGIKTGFVAYPSDEG
jgi:GNAT superfamily N-acetyltransferase